MDKSIQPQKAGAQPVGAQREEEKFIVVQKILMLLDKLRQFSQSNAAKQKAGLTTAVARKLASAYCLDLAQLENLLNELAKALREIKNQCDEEDFDEMILLYKRGSELIPNYVQKDFSEEISVTIILF